MNDSDTQSSKSMRGLQKFLLNDKNIKKNGFIWHMSGSMLNAFQSVFSLIIINRALTTGDSGIFEIAFANANLFLNVGKYGMRYYHVSDVKQEHSFADYFTSRVITSIIMIIAAMAYIAYSAITNQYSFYKTMIIIVMCLLKLIDCFEDVFGGQYQNQDRLDVGGRIMTLRMIALLVVFGACIVILRNMLIALLIALTTNFLIWLYMTLITYKQVHVTFGIRDKKSIRRLLFRCFPLAAGAFLSFYIGNAPKYAIDRVLTDDMQAIYGFVAMPVFVVGLLNNFIFNPQIVGMTRLWKGGKTKQFVVRVCRQMLVVFGITVVCLAGAFVLGIPVLSKLYACDLTNYKAELLILLLGGGFLGLTGLLNASITIIRFQKSVIWGYLSIAVLALLFSDKVISRYGIRGAAVLYTSLMALLALVFVGLFIAGVQIKKKTVLSEQKLSK